MTDSQTYYHGTKADLKVGDLIAPGHASNYGKRKPGNFIYLSATLDAATGEPSWQLAKGVAGSISWSRPAPSKTIPT